jgi:hypothetical protein
MAGNHARSVAVANSLSQVRMIRGMEADWARSRRPINLKRSRSGERQSVRH